MLIFSCQVCNTQLTTEDAQAGTMVRCPFCKAAIRVPLPKAAATPKPLPTHVKIPSRLMKQHVGPGKKFGFNCGYCSSRLEATEAQSAQSGQCPTCGNTITIPILDRYNRLIDPLTQEIIKQDPHPVHAYAAAGERAPQIVRLQDGGQAIECPRCNAISPVTANNCRECGMPFTMEGTTLEAAGTSDGFCVASLVLGIIGMPAFCALVPAILAIVFGIIGYQRVTQTEPPAPGRAMAIAGIVCGGIGALGGLWYYVL